ncbi:GNAT family N-acetyltransferase [Sphingomonas sp. ST-64]|uniref:GNAT family N-acetyltransferase n=1 Tax=Sphingomonas plantiphila TaxID=3163295 RepID=A0ABW8YQ28_9SPHN
MPQQRGGPEWDVRLGRQTILLGEDETGLRGLMSIDPAGYIDLAFIHPSAQGSGLFRALYQQIEAQALARGTPVLNVHASRMALGAFTAVGFETVEREVVAIADQSLERFAMRKHLSA